MRVEGQSSDCVSDRQPSTLNPQRDESGGGAFVQQFLDESNQLGVLKRFREKSLALRRNRRTMRTEQDSRRMLPGRCRLKGVGFRIEIDDNNLGGRRRIETRRGAVVSTTFDRCSAWLKHGFENGLGIRRPVDDEHTRG